MSRTIYSYILTSFLGLQYGSFGYGWHGRHYDQLLLRTVSPRTLVRAHAMTCTALCVAPLIVVFPAVGIMRPSLVVPLCALLMYNVGVTVPALIAMGVWQREAIELRQGVMFNGFVERTQFFWK